MPMSYEFSLPANATFRVRMGKWTVYTNPPIHVRYAVVGVLEVREARGPGAAVRVRRYCVSEQPVPVAGTPPAGGRFFKLTKPVQFGREDPDPRFVHYHPTSVGDNSCTCESFTKSSDCVHVQCIRTLAAAGRLDAWVEAPPAGEPPAPRGRFRPRK